MKAVHPQRPRRHCWDSSPILSRVVLFLLVLLALLGIFMILRPFLAPIVLALLLAVICYPVYQQMLQATGCRRNIAAFVTVIFVFLLVMLPLALFLTALVEQGIEVFRAIEDWVQAGNLDEALDVERLRAIVEHPRIEQLQDFYQRRFGGSEQNGLSLDLDAALLKITEKAINYATTQIVPLVKGVGLIVFNFFIMLFVMFYAFRDGETMLRYVLDVIPLAASNERMLVQRARYLAKALLLGILVTAAVQAGLAMIAFKVVGIPALFWGAMLGIASLIPVVGTALVWVPAVIYLFIIGEVWQAFFLLGWCMIVVGLADNFLRPILMRGRSGMSTVVVFFALLGGIRLFGPIGIVYGPLIFGLGAAIIYIYRIENSAMLSRLQRE